MNGSNLLAKCPGSSSWLLIESKLFLTCNAGRVSCYDHVRDEVSSVQLHMHVHEPHGPKLAPPPNATSTLTWSVFAAMPIPKPDASMGGLCAAVIEPDQRPND